MLGVSTGFFWIIAVVSVLGALVSWSGPYAHAQDEQSQHVSSSRNANTGRKIAKESEGQSSGWRKYKEKIERNEKFITATSTIFIAAFTVLLAFATFFLWSSTRDLVDDTKHNAERQLRAYVFPQELHVSDVELGKHPSATLVVKNTGLTPATEVVAWAGVWVGNFPLTAELIRATPEFMKTASRRSVGPGSSFTINNSWNEILTAQHIQMLQNGTAAVFVWGEITYLDIFGRKRTTGFRSYYGGDTGLRAGGATTTAQDGNDSD